MMEPVEDRACPARGAELAWEGDVRVTRLANKTPRPSARGKTLVVASTRGDQKTAVQIDGKDLYLGVNAYVYAEPKGTK